MVFTCECAMRPVADSTAILLISRSLQATLISSIKWIKWHFCNANSELRLLDNEQISDISRYRISIFRMRFFT